MSCCWRAPTPRSTSFPLRKWSRWAATLSPTATVYSPVIDRQHIYGVDGLEEIDVDFVEGNRPHWLPQWVRGADLEKREIALGE